VVSATGTTTATSGPFMAGFMSGNGGGRK